MCFGGPKVDNSVQQQQLEEAAQARQREEERQARVTSGSAKLDQIFSGFDDNFYDARRAAYTGFYKPQLDDQFRSAQDQLTFSLARAGTLNSTMAADKQGELKNKYDVQNASIISQADGEAAALRQRINNEKSALVAQLNATGDADRVSNEALGRTQQMFHEKPAYSPIGDIFSGVAAGIGNYYNARQNTAMHNAYFGANSPSGSRSGVYTVR